MSARRFAGNTLWMLVADVIGKVAGFALFVILARGLGVTEYGYFNFAIAFVALFLMFARWGIDTTFVRELAPNRERLSELFASGLLVRGVLGLIALGLSLGLSPLFVEGETALLAVIIIGWALYFDEMSTFLSSVFQAFEQMRFSALILVANRILTSVLALVAFAFGGGLVLVCITYMVGSLGALVCGWVLLLRRFPPVALRDARRPLVERLFRHGAALGLASFLNMAVFRIDAVMVQVIDGPRSVAMYGVAYRFFESFLFVAWALGRVALPALARASRERWGRILLLSNAASLAFYLPVAAGAPFVASWLVTKIFSARYAEAAPAVAWLAAAGAFYAIAYLARIAAIALGHRSAIAKIAAGVVVFNIGLNLVLIPRYGFLGAAIATLATEVLEAGLLVGLLVRARGGLRIEGVLGAPVAASLVMALFLAFSGVQGLSAIAFGALVYLGGLLLASRLFAPHEARMALSLARRPAAPPSPGADPG